MKLIDILVEELPKRGGWPEGVCEISTHASGRVFFDGRFAPRGFSLPMASDAWNKYKHPYSYTNAVTREQYEASLAAKSDGWISWGGGECPVPDDALVEVQFRNRTAFHVAKTSDANLLRWSQDGSDMDIIAYRMSMPSEKYAQFEASQVWSGEGLPPVGCDCERSWAGDEWKPCQILFVSNQIVVVKLKESGREDVYNIGDVTFRPIRSEADRKRDEAVKTIMSTGWCQAAAEEIYDLVAAGKVPGMKLEG